jgi:hypothetical protein
MRRLVLVWIIGSLAACGNSLHGAAVTRMSTFVDIPPGR